MATKRKMNDYFKAMLKAKRSNAKSFTYKGSTYVSKKTKTGMLIYKKK
jgi:hypothetical protein|tara:strand:- start:2299 stop:2442 length:144 start_codon:yes stop_codon:yes gene_type:complete